MRAASSRRVSVVSAQLLDVLVVAGWQVQRAGDGVPVATALDPQHRSAVDPPRRTVARPADGAGRSLEPVPGLLARSGGSTRSNARFVTALRRDGHG